MKCCPLCGSEYRQDRFTCANCGAPLVDLPHSEQIKDNPPVLLWVGKDSVEFDDVAAALRQARIPAYAEEGLGGLVGRLLNAASKIHVLQSDLEEALTIAREAIARRTNGLTATQTCYDCGAECSAAFARCPKCKSILIVEPKKKSDSAEQILPRPQTLKYCPICDAEYRASHDRCTVCGVELVPEELRGGPLTEAEKRDRLELVWRGGDPSALSQALALLREAGIRNHVQSSSDHLVFELAMPRPKYNLRVLHSDAERARQLLAGVVDSSIFGADIIPDLPEDGSPRVEAPANRWNPAAAIKEIWVGEDAAFAKVLEDCLRENRVGFRRQGTEPGTLHVYVMAVDESAAREIVREIIEAAPPE
jgi:predicted Zn-ribbon and HTH transcriptional regulator